jgi:hypothetical protein
MPSDRIQRQIEELLTEAESAIRTSDWSRVRDRANAVIALDGTHEDAVAYLKAAEANLTDSAAGAQPIHIVDEPGQWEMCRIEWEPRTLLGTGIGYHTFWANATSPTVGGYSAGRSPQFAMTAAFARGLDAPPDGRDKHSVAMFNELRDRLVYYGWESAGSGDVYWWQERFRRLVTAEPPAIASLHVRWRPNPNDDVVLLEDDSLVNLKRVTDAAIELQVGSEPELGWVGRKLVGREHRTAYVLLGRRGHVVEARKRLEATRAKFYALVGALACPIPAAILGALAGGAENAAVWAVLGIPAGAGMGALYSMTHPYRAR